MNIDDLKSARQTKGYSIDMMAALIHIPVEKYLELEYNVRVATAEEAKQLAEILGR